jgi:hypothetical protein
MTAAGTATSATKNAPATENVWRFFSTILATMRDAGTHAASTTAASTMTCQTGTAMAASNVSKTAIATT